MVASGPKPYGLHPEYPSFILASCYEKAETDLSVRDFSADRISLGS